jgi:serralysin
VIFGDTVIKLSDIENLRGSVYGDTLTGDDNPNTLTGEEGNDKLAGKGGVDTIFGGDGNDKITGGTDADLLRGNAGDDTFIYTAVAESAAKHDIIADFQHSHDQIDLSKLHPDTKDDKFIFIGDHNFGHHAGELEVVQHDNSGTANDFTMVLADLDGNGKADLQIELTHLVHLDKGDFIL